MAKKVRLPGQSATEHNLSLAQLTAALEGCDRETLSAYQEALKSDTRKGVLLALTKAAKRLDTEEAEQQRIAGLYAFEAALAKEAGATVWVGLDEVGRGPVAGPLATGAVVLDPASPILGLNDSKQLSEETREALAAEIREKALAWAVAFVGNDYIDAHGMTASLKKAFSDALAQVEEKLGARGSAVGLVLLDGNPLRFDPREKNVVKGDAKCASIAAASIVAKVARDRYMAEQAAIYPVYGWESNKGYASKQHTDAIAEFGLTPLHRKTFCTSFSQYSLF